MMMLAPRSGWKKPFVAKIILNWQTNLDEIKVPSGKSKKSHIIEVSLPLKHDVLSRIMAESKLQRETMLERPRDRRKEMHLFVFQDISLEDWKGEDCFRMLFAPIFVKVFKGHTLSAIEENIEADSVCPRGGRHADAPTSPYRGGCALRKLRLEESNETENRECARLLWLQER